MHGSPDTIDKIFTSALYQLLTPRKYAKRTVGLNTFRATWFRRFFAKKTAVFCCLTNALAPLPIALESCSAAQTDRPV